MPRCPRDPKLNYNIKFCREIVKSGLRVWCKDCVHAKAMKKKGKKK